MEKQKRYWLWLSSIRGIGAATFYTLIERYEDAYSVWMAVKKDDFDLNIIGQKKEILFKYSKESYIDKVINKCKELDINIVTRLDDEYPEYLAEITNPPPVLFYKGHISKITKRAIGIVGTRNCSARGAEFVNELAYDLGQNGVCVVSGMARGIDSAAHIGALKTNSPTFAVLGCGVDTIYPKENQKIYNDIIKSGAVLSEYLPTIQPLSTNFPARNRIISGLSRGIIVVESAFKGGANITVKYALDQGREVMAVPYSPYDVKHQLPNDIIKNGGLLVNSAKDVLTEFGWQIEQKNTTKKDKLHFKLDFFEEQIYNLLLQGDLSVDELTTKLNIDYSNILTSLTLLEMKKIIIKRPGNIYGLKRII